MINSREDNSRKPGAGGITARMGTARMGTDGKDNSRKSGLMGPWEAAVQNGFVVVPSVSDGSIPELPVFSELPDRAVQNAKRVESEESEESEKSCERRMHEAVQNEAECCPKWFCCSLGRQSPRTPSLPRTPRPGCPKCEESGKQEKREKREKL